MSSTLNPFQQMSASLRKVRPPSLQPGQAEHTPYKPITRTETIRRLLKATDRAKSAAEIAWDMDDFPNFGTHLVWLLLKHDIKNNRVIFQDGLYRWNREHDSAEATKVRAAVKLLLRKGYQVVPPKAV